MSDLSDAQTNKLSESSSLEHIFILLVFVAAAAVCSQAQTLTTLVKFDGVNGDLPTWAPLAIGVNGNFYGTTFFGGAHGSGEVFEVSPAGVFTVLYSFCSLPGCADGVEPQAGLVLASDGNFYGTTEFGGTHNGGTVFRIAPQGTLTTVYNFCTQAGCTDGSAPLTTLVQGSNGQLYGGTASGGANGYGSIFEVTTTGVLTTLYSFCSKTDCADGAEVNGKLILASNGKFYGTTGGGGANGFGTVFDMTSTGTLTTLHSFRFTDGSYPIGGLVEATDKNLYGTTSLGGTSNNGTVFKVTQAGTLTTLHNFCSKSYCTDGSSPQSGLIQGTSGILYGTTSGGGVSHRGTVFQMTTAGSLTTLHSFTGADGEIPYAALLQGSNGDLYGTTYAGGNLSCIRSGGGCGTVFALTP